MFITLPVNLSMRFHIVRTVRHAMFALLVVAFTASVKPLSAEDLRSADSPNTAAEFLPESTLVYVELTNPPQLVERILTHPLAEQVKANETLQALYSSPDVAKARLGLGFVELGLGMPWQTLVERVAGGGVYLVIDGEAKQPIALVRAKDAKSLDELRERVFKLLRDDAKNKGRGDPIEKGEYRGLTGYKIDRVSFVTMGPWLAVSEKSEVLKTVVDAWLDRTQRTLAAAADFQAARQARPADAFAWGFLRLNALREGGLAPALAAGKSDNPVAELLIGGILTTLQKTPYASAALTLERDGTRLLLAVPHNDEWVPQTRRFYFGPESKGAAPQPLDIPGRIAVLRTWRDLGGMWAAAPDLFDERVNGELAQANSNLSTVLGGKDFGQDVLESLGAELQLLVARPQYEQEAPVPAIKLPAFGLVARLRDAESSKRLWRAMFQTLVGFINIGGGQQGLPLLELETEKLDDAPLVVGRYVAPEKRDDAAVVGMHYNFSPSLAIVGDRLVIASNRPLAGDLIKAIRQADKAAAPPARNASDQVVNTELAVDGAAVHAILTDNQRQLVAQNMLDKGHDRAAAEAEIGALLAIAQLVRGLGLQLSTEGQQVRFEARLRFATKDGGQ